MKHLKHKFLSLAGIALFLLTALPDGHSQCDNNNDYKALGFLYVNSGGDRWLNRTNWPDSTFFMNNTSIPPGTDLSTWYGITCANGRVTHIELPDNDLDGILTDRIRLASKLEVLNLGNISFSDAGENNLHDTLPSSLGTLDSLKILDLRRNNFSGQIPSSLGDLSKLEDLELSWNDLSGEFPATLTQLTSLHTMNIGYNELTGPLPNTWGSMDALENLYLFNNQLSGSLPSSIGSMDNLVELRIGDNQFTGSIPNSYNTLTSLRSFDISRCNLLGTIPSWIDQLQELDYLYLQGNSLSGTIPSEIGSIPDLGWLNLSENQLTGPIPTELDNVRYQIILHNNQLTGPIPAALAGTTSLSLLDLSDNQLSGTIPGELGNTSLHTLLVDNNDLYGCWDSNLSNLCSSLTTFDFEGNNYDPVTGDFISDVGWTQFCNNMSGACSDLFVFTIKTDNPGASNDQSFIIPTDPSYDYDYEIDWSYDGFTFNVEASGVSGSRGRNYGTPGTYTIAIRGDFPAIYFNNTGDKEKLLSIDEWGGNRWKSMRNAFAGCSNMDILATDAPDLSEVESFFQTFAYCSSLSGDQLVDWRVQNVTDFSYMFYENDGINADLSSWDVSRGEFFDLMFFNAASFNQNLGTWDLSQAVSAAGFLDGSGLDITQYDTTLIQWEANNHYPTGITLGVDGLSYCAGEGARMAMASSGLTFSGDTRDCTSDCLETKIVSQSDIADGVTISAIDTIMTSGNITIPVGDSVIFSAGQEVLLNPEFTVDGVFEILTTPCNTLQSTENNIE